MEECFGLMETLMNAEFEKQRNKLWRKIQEGDNNMICGINDNNGGMIPEITLPPIYYTTSARKYVCSLGNPNDIVDVNVIVPNKVVEVTFGDGDKQKSVCQEGDTFSLEMAITICLCKHLMCGSGKYNKTVNKAVKIYLEKLDRIEDEKAEEERIAKKKAKKAAYKARKEQRWLEEQKAAEQKEMERQIEIQKEAYIRAMEYMKHGGIW